MGKCATICNQPKRTISGVREREKVTGTVLACVLVENLGKLLLETRSFVSALLTAAVVLTADWSWIGYIASQCHQRGLEILASVRTKPNAEQHRMILDLTLLSCVAVLLVSHNQCIVESSSVQCINSSLERTAATPQL